MGVFTMARQPFFNYRKTVYNDSKITIVSLVRSDLDLSGKQQSNLLLR